MKCLQSNMVISTTLVHTENCVSEEEAFLKQINGNNGFKTNIHHSIKF